MTKHLTKAQRNKADKVCKIISGGISLREACRQLKMSPEAFRQWRLVDDNLQARYTRAKEDRAINIFEDILSIVDDTDADPQDRRLRMDARKWMLGKMLPKRYGEKIEHEGHLTIKIADDVRKL